MSGYFSYEHDCRSWAMAARAGHGGGPHRFGRGGPFGRHRGGPFGGRGPRMFDQGALRLVVLGLIEEEPRHGYDIIKALETRFEGAYSPSPGAIYPMLQMLEEADLVTASTAGSKRVFAISEAGRAYLDEHRAELDNINSQLDEASGGLRSAAIGEDIHEFRRALRDKLRHGTLTAEQVERVRQILREARRALDEL
jgi:DNA-binding PadR family transcriptional regulator